MAKKHVVVPHTIKYMNAQHHVVILNPGIQMVDEEVLNHPYVLKQGVKEYDPAAEAKKLRDEAEAAEEKAAAMEKAAAIKAAEDELAAAAQSGDDKAIKAAEKKLAKLKK